MSFPKANFKRFNEVSGCAPPVGAYDPKLSSKQAGGLIDKSERFKAPQDVGSDVLDTPSKKRIPSDSVCGNTSVFDSSILKPKTKKAEQTPSADSIKIKELEREIRMLLQERTNRDKVLSHREEEITKLEGRLANAQTDRSSLIAKVATLEKSMKDANKSNDLLKNKISAAENAGKRNEATLVELSNLKHQLELKDKEIHRLDQEIDTLKKSQLSDFTLFESIIVSLENRVDNFEDGKLYGSPQKTESVKTETTKTGEPGQASGKPGTSKKNVEKLKNRFEKVIQMYSSKVDDMRQAMQEKCNTARQQQESLVATLRQTEENMLQQAKEIQAEREKTKDQRKLLYSKIRSLTDKNWSKEDEVRFLKGEVSAVCDLAGEMDQETFELEAEVAVLTEKMDQLEEEKNTLNENIKILMEKFQILEKNHGHERKSSGEIIKNLKYQLGIAQTSLADIQREKCCLEEKNNELIRKMHDQLEEIETLASQLEDKEIKSDEMTELIKDKENMITDLDVQLVGARIEMEHLKEKAEIQEKEIETLKVEIQKEVDSIRKQLQEEEEIHQRTARGHADQIIDLEKRELSLIEENEKHKKEVEESTQKCMELKNMVENLNTEIANLTEQSEKELKRLLDTKENEMKSMEENLQKVKEENEKLERTITEKEDCLLNCQATISNLEEKIAILRADAESLEREYEELKQSQGNAMESIMKRAEKTKEENVKLKGDLECVIKEKHELFCKVAELQVSSTETDSSLAEKQQLIETLSEKNGNLEEQVRIISEEKEKLDLVVTELNVKLKETAEDIVSEKSLLVVTESTLKAQLEQLQQEVERNKDECVKKEKDVTSLLVENSQLMKEIDYLNALKEQDLDQMSEQLVGFEERVKHLIEEKASLYQKTADIATEKERLEVENLRLKNQAEQAADDLEKEKLMLTEREESISTQLNKLQEQKLSYEQVITALQRQLKESQETMLDLQNECEQLTKESKSEQADKESRIQALELKLNSVTEENSCLTDQMGQAEQVKCKLKAEVEDLKTKITNITKSHDAEVQKHLDNIQELQKSLYISTNSNQKELNQLQSELSNVVKKKMEDNKLFTEKISKAKSELQSERQIRQTLEEDFNLLQGRCRDQEVARLALTKAVDKLEEERDHLKSQNQDLGEQISQKEVKEQELLLEIQKLQSALRDAEAERLEEKERHRQEIAVLSESVQAQANQEELDNMTAEAEKWQKLFEDLQTKVEPFMEQLDAFELEKQALLGRSNHAQAEMDKLSSQYAKLLGHQNQKQKIHHVAKIKEENNTLKREMTMLKEQLTKQKRTIQKLEEKAGTTDGKKKFDPSMAFKHSKENLAPTSSPLRDDLCSIQQHVEASEASSVPFRKHKYCHSCGKRKLSKGNRK
ncbi:hyaluronan mediated motility receptor-like isoform X3 [Saccostrea cucullata]|uniref:hyaluronan mediated motility receptor-like isoform X3 n=1 Tax=Saccostrea cuccullata TaxID=36930 RepID=UPI002ED21134